ncbi:uncharacterized protein LOC125210822 isoform X2 [Salvia hispanica]|uniref:uncharacterized protein LOC125210822 isoform X2 n=1 Tax=Salvia hispanica TaxID=49212 RepID=UPI0020094173|nr:uncharacterized protein LOC125210822 isoform X2 [Salvia hispanica]
MHHHSPFSLARSATATESAVTAVSPSRRCPLSLSFSLAALPPRPTPLPPPRRSPRGLEIIESVTYRNCGAVLVSMGCLSPFAGIRQIHLLKSFGKVVMLKGVSDLVGTRAFVVKWNVRDLHPSLTSDWIRARPF